MKGAEAVPRIWRALLRASLPGNTTGAAVLDELDQEYADRAAEDARNARRWYGRQARRVVIQYALPGRLRTLRETVAQRLYGTLLLLPADIRAALRSLRANPIFSLVAVLVLAPGIGIATAAFSVLDAVVLRGLPYSDPRTIVQVWDEYPAARDRASSVSEPNLNDYRAAGSAFDRWAAIANTSMYTTGERIVELRAAAVTGDFFALAPAVPVLGRTLVPADDLIEDGAPIMISHELWQEQFGGNAAAIGMGIELLAWRHGQGWAPWTARIVGVLPPDYTLPPFQGSNRLVTDLSPELVVNYASANWGWGNRGMWHYRVLASLARGRTLEQGRQQLSVVAARIAQEHPRTNQGYDVAVHPITEVVGRVYSRPLGLILAAAMLVLLVGCANVAGLLLARGAARGQELAIRSALGAGRLRLCRQALLESAALGVVSAGAGILLARWLTNAVRASSQAFFRQEVIHIDPRAAVFAVMVGIVATLGFGLGPAWRGAAPGALDRLRGRGGSRRVETLRSLRGLVMAQVALAFVLLVAAGLMVSSFRNLVAVDMGFEPAAVVRVHLESPARQLSKRSGQLEQMDFLDDLERRLETLPEVEKAAAATAPALAGTNLVDVTIPRPDGSVEHVAGDWRNISRDYFDVMGIALQAGRAPAATDYEAYRRVAALRIELDNWDWGTSEPVHLLPRFWEELPVWISVSMASSHWPGIDPVGQTFHWGHQPSEALAQIGTAFEIEGQDNRYPWPSTLRVAGVVADARSADLVAEPTLQFYSMRTFGARTLVLRLKGGTGSESYARVIETIESADPQELRVASMVPMVDLLAEASSPNRLGAELATAAGTLAVLLTAAGLLGVLAYAVGQRRREFGIRISLGARTADITRLVLADGARLIGAGLVLGLGIGLAGGRYLESLLYRVSPSDPVALLSAGLVVGAVGLLACVLPLYRARRVDPMQILRQD
jgi:putative ABC transport system permease protein